MRIEGESISISTKKEESMWYVYIIECSDNTLYVGVTLDIERRLKEHNSGKGGRYTRARMPVNLIYNESYNSKSKALKREIQIKGWTKRKKIALIQNNYVKLGQYDQSK
ncbi:MAG: GIY-YIG nuclease family protein [bacterium]